MHALCVRNLLPEDTRNVLMLVAGVRCLVFRMTYGRSIALVSAREKIGTCNSPRRSRRDAHDGSGIGSEFSRVPVVTLLHGIALNISRRNFQTTVPTDQVRGASGQDLRFKYNDFQTRLQKKFSDHDRPAARGACLSPVRSLTDNLNRTRRPGGQHRHVDSERVR